MDENKSGNRLLKSKLFFRFNPLNKKTELLRPLPDIKPKEDFGEEDAPAQIYLCAPAGNLDAGKAIHSNARF